MGTLSRRRALGGLTALLSAALGLAALPAAASSGPSGNHAALALYATMVPKVNAKTVIDDVVSKDFYFGYTTGGYWFLSADTATYPYQRAVNDTVVAVLKHGKVSWATETFAAACAGHPHCAALVPLEFYETTAKAYWAELSGPHTTATCWYTATGSTAWVKTDYDLAGQPYWWDGHDPATTEPVFKSLVTGSTTDVVVLTYTNTKFHRGVVETDHVTVKTDLPATSTFAVAKGTTKAEKAYTYDAAFSYPKGKAPAAPTIHACA